MRVATKESSASNTSFYLRHSHSDLQKNSTSLAYRVLALNSANHSQKPYFLTHKNSEDLSKHTPSHSRTLIHSKRNNSASKALHSQSIQSRVKHLESALYSINTSLIDEKILEQQQNLHNRTLYKMLAASSSNVSSQKDLLTQKHLTSQNELASQKHLASQKLIPTHQTAALQPNFACFKQLNQMFEIQAHHLQQQQKLEIDEHLEPEDRNDLKRRRQIIDLNLEKIVASKQIPYSVALAVLPEEQCALI